MTKSGHFPAALARALEFYDNTSVLAVTQLPPPPHPSDTPNERDAAIHLHRAVVGEFVAGMVASYVNMAVSGYDPSSATMQQQSHPADGKDATAGNGVSDAGGGGSSAIFNGQPLQSAHYLLTIADVDGRSSSSSSGILPNTSSDALDSSLLESIAAPNLHQSDFILVFKSLILLVIQVYVRIDRLDVLFGEVFEKISEADSDQTTKSAATSWSNTINKRLTNIFIEVLEPFILKGDIQVICNPQVMNALLDYFNMLATSATIASHSSTNNNPSSSLFSLSSSTSSSPPSLTSTELVRRRLENVITSLDLNAFSFDLHHAVQVCRRLKIYTALVYIYSVAVKDYITPIIELMLLVQDLAGSIESTSKLYSSTWFDPAATIITTASLNGNNSNINSNTTDASKIEAAAQVTYLLFFYLASTLSGRIFPTAVVMDQPEATRAKSAVYNFLFSPDFMSWDSLGINAHTVGKLLAVSGTNNNQGGNNIEGDDVYDASDAATSFYIGFHPPFPYVRRLLLLDSNEFMKVIGIAFEDDMLSGGELTIDDDSTTTTTTTTSTFTSPSSRGFDRRQMSQITRQFILDALFSVLEGTVSHKPTGGQFTSVFTRSAFSKSDLMALYGFVARNYGRYSTFLYFDEDTLKRMVSLLVNFDGDNPSLSSSSSTTITSTSISRSEREVSILALLNSFNLSYKGAELDQLTSECETKQLWRVCESIYRKEHKFERILACYLYDPHRKASAFSCVRQLFENGDLNFETSLAVKREFIELVADYVSISGSATAAVVEDYFPNDHQTCISRLEKSGGEILLDYLSGLFETQLDFLLEWKRTGNSQDDVEFHLIRDETGSCSGGGKFDLSAKKQPVVGATRYKLYPSYFYDKAIELLLIYNKMIILPFIKHLYDVYGRIPVGSVEKILASLTAARVVNATCFVLEKSGRVQEALSVLLDTYNEVWELYYEQKFKDNKPAPQPQMTLDHLLAPPAQLKDGAKSDAYTVAPASGTSSIGGGWKKIFTASMRDIQLDYVLKKAISLIYCHSGNMNTVIQQGLWLSLLGVVLQDRSPSQYSTEESTITLSLSDSSPTAAMLGKRTFSIESCKFVMEAMVGYVPLPKILSHTLDKEREPVHLSDYKDIITSLIENYFFEKNLLVSANRLMGQYVSAVNRTNMKARAVGVACLGTKQSGICQACKKPVVSTSAMSSHSTETDESRQKQQQQQEWFKGLVVFYYCRHVYHERCLLSPSTQGAAIPQHRRGNLVQCPVCNPYGEQEEVEVEEVSKGKAIRDQVGSENE